MSRIQVNVANDLTKVANVDEILPKEFAIVMAWKEQGILEHLFTKTDKTGAILVFNDIEETKIKELMLTLPLAPYFEKVEYTILDKHF